MDGFEIHIFQLSARMILGWEQRQSPPAIFSHETEQIRLLLTGASVMYNNRPEEFNREIESFLSVKIMKKLYVVDNSFSSAEIRAYLKIQVTYIYIYSSLGLGAGHNIAINLSKTNRSAYHLVMNPDVYFHPYSMKTLVEFMHARPEIGLAMPKILFPNGELQYLCKLLPTPIDLIGRRFFSFLPWFRKRNDHYELRSYDYSSTMEVPFLSGSFMLVRRQALEEVGCFDERFFLYLEDVDLCRRIGGKYKTAYCPQAQVYHTYSRASYKKISLLYQHIRSAILYFNKWGWLQDGHRDKINWETLNKLNT